MADSKEKLFSDFIPTSTQEWLDKITVDLKGADFGKKLVWRTNEGFNVQPFYRREDVLKLKTPDALPGEFPYVRGNKKDSNVWYIRQNIYADEAATANAKALDVLNKGIDSLGFHICGNEVSVEFIDALLQGIACEAVELNFTTCPKHVLELSRILTAYFEQKGCDKKQLVGSVDFDPIKKMVMEGKDATPSLGIAPKLIEVWKDYPHFRCITVNSESLNNAGAYIAQELGYALSWGNEYLQELTDAGVNADLAATKIKFNMGVSENYFMELAKFRTARMLWAQIVREYAPKHDESCQMIVNATTSKYNQTLFDSYVNLLRSQTEAMSAALGGVHSMVVTPFLLREPDRFLGTHRPQSTAAAERRKSLRTDRRSGSRLLLYRRIDRQPGKSGLGPLPQDRRGRRIPRSRKSRNSAGRYQRYERETTWRCSQTQRIHPRHQPVPELQRKIGRQASHRQPMRLWQGGRTSVQIDQEYPLGRRLRRSPHPHGKQEGSDSIHADHRQPGHASGPSTVLL